MGSMRYNLGISWFCAQSLSVHIAHPTVSMAMRKVAAMAALRRLAACEAKIAGPMFRSLPEVNPGSVGKSSLAFQLRGYAAEPAPQPSSESANLTDKTGSKMGSVKAVSAAPHMTAGCMTSAIAFLKRAASFSA